MLLKAIIQHNLQPKQGWKISKNSASNMHKHKLHTNIWHKATAGRNTTPAASKERERKGCFLLTKLLFKPTVLHGGKVSKNKSYFPLDMMSSTTDNSI